MTGEHWRGEEWPESGEEPRSQLPSPDELPVVDRGYDQQRVHDAFDAFYRHIAQLDSTLRAIEAVEAFRQQSGELRRELRALRAAGWTQQPWPTQRAGRASPGIPESVPRFAIEAAFLIVVAVVVAVAGFDPLSIVLVMALAWAIVGVVEWAASRERFSRATPVSSPPAPRAEEARALPAAARPELEPPAVEQWPVASSLVEESAEQRTVVRGPGSEVFGEVEAEPEPRSDVGELSVFADTDAEQERSAGEAGELPDEAARQSWAWAADPVRETEGDEPAKERGARGRFWRRRKGRAEAPGPDESRPKHVRVLPPPPTFDQQFPVEPREPERELDPWEEDFDISVEAGEPDPDTGGGTHADRPLAEVQSEPRREGEPDESD